jgi:hypothetical protein
VESLSRREVLLASHAGKTVFRASMVRPCHKLQFMTRFTSDVTAKTKCQVSSPDSLRQPWNAELSCKSIIPK